MSSRKIWFGLAFIFVILWSCAPRLALQESGLKKAPEPPSVSMAKVGWEAEWEKIVQQAKKEGKVVLYGSPVAETRQGFIESFQKAYPGITLDYTAMLGTLAAPKTKAERRAGLYTVDLHTGGTNTILSDLRQFAVPIKPYLVLPEVKDPKVWLEGRLDFSDDAEEINLVYTINISSRVTYNSQLLEPGEITSWWDLTNPKWKGKIIMRDPRVAGQGNATATFWYLEPKLGLDYIKAFAANRPVLSRDPRLETESVARGKYSIGVSLDPPGIKEFQKAGMPIKYTEILKEGTYSSAATGSVIVLDKAPHPNATTVFLNWLLGKEAQTIWTRTSGYASRRLDAPTDHLIEIERPKSGVAYSANYKEAVAMKKDEVAKTLTEIFAGF